MFFGGYKMFGNGRELGEYGLEVYLEVKFVSFLESKNYFFNFFKLIALNIYCIIILYIN